MRWRIGARHRLRCYAGGPIQGNTRHEARTLPDLDLHNAAELLRARQRAEIVGSTRS